MRASSSSSTERPSAPTGSRRSPSPAKQAEQSFADEFARLRTNRDMTELRERIEPFFKAPPDKTLSFVAEMDMGVPEGVPVIYVCPMHPEVVSEEPGSCPKCGMKLLAQAAEETTYVCPMHPEVTSDKPDRCPKCGMKLLAASLVEAGGGDAHEHHHDHGHEPEHEERATQDTRTTSTTTSTATTAATTISTASPSTLTTPRRGSSGKTTWSRSTGKRRRRTCAGSSSIATPAPKTPRSTGHSESATRSRSGSSTRWTRTIRCRTRSTSTAQDDFSILARDDVVEPNLVWKDTVLVRTGETVDILLDVTNPGRWMAHCHIAEHHESGMMLSFNVEP